MRTSFIDERLQGSTEVFFRKARFWDGGGQDAPPVFLVDGINYLHVKVGNPCAKALISLE